MAIHNELGKWGEDVVVEYLRRKGYQIVERDWHSGHRDLDIVAMDGQQVVFVEVKTRRNTIFMEPEEAVDWRKQRNLMQAINHYVRLHQIIDWRFDVVTVVGVVGGNPEINHIEDFALSAW